MKIMLTGCNGQVGWELARSLMPLGEVIALDRNGCDLSRPELLAALVSDLMPDVVVNAAAYTAVDKAESEEPLARRINADAVAELGRGARKAGALFIHYSTDHVFDGAGQSAYFEADPVSPLNAYGRSKLAGEQAVAASGCDYLVFRTTWVYAARGHNFLLTMLRLGMERTQLRVVDDQIGAPTWARNIADATVGVLSHSVRERSASRFESGIFHMTGAGKTSWHGFASEIFTLANALFPQKFLKPEAVQPISSEEYVAPARRPLNSRLNQEKLAQRFGLSLPAWQHSLRYCLLDMRDAACLKR